MTKAVFLVGFMGSGKSSVGNEIARAIGWEVVDTDELIIESEGRTIDRIFAEDGEGRLESDRPRSGARTR